jgi:hypothetical protein
MPSRAISRPWNRRANDTVVSCLLTKQKDGNPKVVFEVLAGRLEGFSTQAGPLLDARTRGEITRRRALLSKDPGLDVLKEWLVEAPETRAIGVALSISGLYSIVIDCGEQDSILPGSLKDARDDDEEFGNLALVAGHLLRLAISDSQESESNLENCTKAGTSPASGTSPSDLLYKMREITLYPVAIKPDGLGRGSAEELATLLIAPDALVAKIAKPGFGQISSGFLNAEEPLLAIPARYGGQVDRILLDLRRDDDTKGGILEQHSKKLLLRWSIAITLALLVLVFLNGVENLVPAWGVKNRLFFDRLSYVETGLLFIIFFFTALWTNWRVYAQGSEGSPQDGFWSRTYIPVCLGTFVLLAAWIGYLFSDIGELFGSKEHAFASPGEKEGTPMSAFRDMLWALPGLGMALLKYAYDQYSKLCDQIAQKQTNIRVLDRLSTLVKQAAMLRPSVDAVFQLPARHRAAVRLKAALARLPDFKKAELDISEVAGVIERRRADADQKSSWKTAATLGLAALLVGFSPLAKLKPDSRFQESTKLAQTEFNRIGRELGHHDNDWCARDNGGKCSEDELRVWLSVKQFQRAYNDANANTKESIDSLVVETKRQIKAMQDETQKHIGALEAESKQQTAALSASTVLQIRTAEAASLRQLRNFNDEMERQAKLSSELYGKLDDKLNAIEAKMNAAALGPPSVKPIADAIVAGITEGLGNAKLDGLRVTILNEVRNAARTASYFGKEDIADYVGNALGEAIGRHLNDATKLKIAFDDESKPALDKLDKIDSLFKNTQTIKYRLDGLSDPKELDAFKLSVAQIVAVAVQETLKQCAAGGADCGTDAAANALETRIVAAVNAAVTNVFTNRSFGVATVPSQCRKPVVQVFYPINQTEPECICEVRSGSSAGVAGRLGEVCMQKIPACRAKSDLGDATSLLPNARQSIVVALDDALADEVPNAGPPDQFQLLLAGYTDSTGPVFQNTVASNARAVRLRDWKLLDAGLLSAQSEMLLVQDRTAGVSSLNPLRIAAIGRGEEVAATPFSSGRMLDDAFSRRVDIYICRFRAEGETTMSSNSQ